MRKDEDAWNRNRVEKRQGGSRDDDREMCAYTLYFLEKQQETNQKN